MKVSIIVAQASNRGIGYDNKLMWRQSDDLKRFKQLTTGHTVIMGRKTFDSIGKPLPNRKNIIISRKTDLQIDGCIVVNSIEAALQLAQNESASEVFIIGGGEIYALTLPISNTLYVTEINTD
jgi:dihydrofolate reductase